MSEKFELSKKSNFSLRLNRSLKRVDPLSVLLASLLAVIAVLLGVIYLSHHQSDMSDQLVKLNDQQTRQNQYLLSKVTYNEKRQRLVLFVRDTIYNYWQANSGYITKVKKIDPSMLTIEKAYRVAETNVTTSEIYPEVDALLLTALQFQESNWGLYRKSNAGALGLNHFMPGTGVLISSAMGLPFSLDMLEDDVISTNMAAKYLNMMYKLYGSWGEALADYNGGPRNARYYKTNDSLLSSETRAYVKSITKMWGDLRDSIKVYRLNLNVLNTEEGTPVEN